MKNKSAKIPLLGVAAEPTGWCQRGKEMIFECHGHIILDGVSYKSAIARHRNGIDEDFVRQNLKTCAEHGILFYRDGGDKHGVSAFAKKIAGEFGINYRTSVFIIHKKGHYGNMFGRAFENISEYRELIAEALRSGADFIKTTASGLLDFTKGGIVTEPALTLEELRMMVNIAHGEGLAVMIHANGADNIKRAAEAGADSIEHGYYMDKQALQIMEQTKSIWVPTCVTVSSLIGSGLYEDEMLQKILDGHKEMLIAAASCGVQIACGSDAGASRIPQGKGTLDELTALQRLGIDCEPGNRAIAHLFKRRTLC